ncbi:hypothetical protein WKI13_02830 [Teredinibacter turnerae]|uniref:hypothetical protein n=1 Tax=Teredinibacter turnerae TaxID=2426 RepID=UPI0003776AE9|nr:hypothetical protein [Teredinibacter turnerae]
MPTLIFKVDCGKADQPIKHDLHTLENKVQEALAELDYDYLVFDIEATEESLLDLEYPEEYQHAVGS